MRIILIALLSFFSNQLLAQTQQFTLENGLKILVREDHRAPIAISMIWYNVGSADEPGGITGISHILEHLMFKGTPKYPLGVFSKTIAGLGGQENAFTSNDYTAYHEKMSAAHLKTSFQLEADRMQHLIFDNEEFSREIKVIQEERRLRTDNNPQALAFERFVATAHLTSPYNHPVIGWMPDLKRMTIDDAKRWYHQFYAPNNATLVVVGDVNAMAIYKLANHYFGTIPRGMSYTRKLQTEPRALGKKSIVVQASAQVPLLIMGYTVPSLLTIDAKEPTSPYVLDLISGILEAGNCGRFNQKLVREMQIASAIDVNYNKFARYQTQFMILGAPNKDHSIIELKNAILAEILRLQTELVSPLELERIKNQIIAQKTFEQDSIEGQAMELGILSTIGLSSDVADQYIQQIKQVTAEQIRTTALRYFQEKNLTEAQLIPKDKA